MYHTTVKKSGAVRLVLVARLPQTSTSFLSENNERRIVELEEHWMCWARPLGVIWAGRGNYNADFRNNSRALAKRFSINDAVQCCKVVLGDQFRIEANTNWILFIWEQVFRNRSCILPFILSYQIRLRPPQPLLKSCPNTTQIFKGFESEVYFYSLFSNRHNQFLFQ